MRAFDNIKQMLIPVLLAGLLQACNITKELRSSQQHLYVGSELQVKGEKRKDVTRPIGDYIKQKPNKKFLGITRLKMRLFYAGSRENSGKIASYLRNHYGEPPVMLDTAFIDASVKSMKGYLKSVGFYYPEITYEVRSKRNRAKVIYYVQTNTVYHIQSYQLNCADKKIYDLLKSRADEALVRSGSRLRQEVLLAEQKRVVDLLRNNGYYTFTSEFVSFDVDTANNNFNVSVSLKVLNKGFYEPHQPHYVSKIFVNIEPNYDISGFKNQDTIKSGKFYFIPNRYEISLDVLERSLIINKEKLFNQQLLTGTYNRLGELNVFRFINITSKNYTQQDTAWVEYYVRLAPTIKYDYVLEPQAIVSDQNNTFTNQSNYGNYGLAGILQFNNRNVFKHAELLTLTLRSSVEAQGRTTGRAWFNATEQSLTASITLPRLVFLNKLDKKRDFLGAKTIFTTSAIYELNSNFERRVLTLAGIYQLNKKYTSFYFTPLEISYTKNDINSSTLFDQINQDIYLFTMFSNNLILGSKVGFNYNNKAKTKGLSHVFLRWDVAEISGNIPTLINDAIKSPKNENGFYEIFDVNYAQFVKTAFDFRYNTKYDANNATVYRLFTGVGIPYGNSPRFLPLERRFWVGGANSLRAWFPRSLGPGSYYQANQIDFSGDIKIEANAEYRFNVYDRWMEGAVFVDAGNVWMSKRDTVRENAHFEWNRFYKEFGIGTGLGVRLNFEIILIRFDFAIPLHDPSYAPGNRWVINRFNEEWFTNNLNFNFGIGYPF
ncbi:MAG: hypothetical protein EAY81_07675 [Bacteroidetes bacterium]|nr:MAG: hypothetical protein EAY81_07675 [Bacteroidota bacterium]